jgi:hypothetical protein
MAPCSSISTACVLTDPLLRDRVVHLRRHAPLPPPQLLSGLDAVLLTHLHRDHLICLPCGASGAGALVVRAAEAGCCCGAGSTVREIAPGEEIALRSLSVLATEARHHGGRGVMGARGPALGYVITGRVASTTPATPTSSRDARHRRDRPGPRAHSDLGWGSRLGPGHLDPCGQPRRSSCSPASRGAHPLGTYAVGPRARRTPSYVRAPLEPFLAAAGGLPWRPSGARPGLARA